MNVAYNFIDKNSTFILLILMVALFFAFLLILFLMLRVNKQKKRIELFFGTKKDRRNMEQMLIAYLDKVETYSLKYDECMAFIENINDRMTLCIQKVGITRYNPFDNMGSDQSFSLALLDENNDGIVISTLHSREGSYTYAKPVNDLKSTYMLTVEETEAIKKALLWKPIVNDV